MGLTKALIKSHRRQGMTYDQIALFYGISPQRVSQIARRDQIPQPRKYGRTPKVKPKRLCLRCGKEVRPRANFCPSPCLILHRRRLRKVNYYKNPDRKEYLKKKRLEWMARNPEKARESNLRAVKKYYLKNREKMLAYSRKRYRLRKDKQQ